VPADVSMTNRRAAERADIVLGEDWDRPQSNVDSELRAARARRSLISLNSSPLARKIILFNLIAIMVLGMVFLWLNPVRDSLVVQREHALAVEAQLIADIFEANLPASAPANLATGDGIDVEGVLSRIGLSDGVDVFIFSADGVAVTSTLDIARSGSRPVRGLESQPNETLLITNFLISIFDGLSGILGSAAPDVAPPGPDAHASLVAAAMGGATILQRGSDTTGSVYAAASPIEGAGGIVGALVVTTAAGEIDQLVRVEQEQLLQMFVVALLVSIVLSLVLASTIANPLADLSAAAELGRDKNARKMSPTRVRIPDLTGRPDEIGRLSGALRGMVAALYDRIDSNEQFAADVAHEIKNPLASLQSAVGTLRIIKREDQRDKLLDVIEHDVRRLDRLVSDISNASRLDAELVKEDEEHFNLLIMLGNLNQYLGEDARAKGIDYISDMPEGEIMIDGLEARLAQVFVNLITNAISFCEEGDAIRVWTRRRENRVLVVVEDTGPGIPEQALTKVFKRFYSQRPEEHFGNNSGLGLAISKQIIEAHGGVIWAENIRPTEADISSDPLGARFVVGLPI